MAFGRDESQATAEDQLSSNNVAWQTERDREILALRRDAASQEPKPKSVAEQVSDMNKEAYSRQIEGMDPYSQAGHGALEDIQGDFMKNWQQDPGYQFRMKEGLRAANAGASARGSSLGGGNMKALTRYGQGMASQEYGNVYNRKYGQLKDLTGLGFSSSQLQAGYSGDYADRQQANLVGSENARVAKDIASSNRQTDMFGNLIRAGGTAIGLAYGNPWAGAAVGETVAGGYGATNKY